MVRTLPKADLSLAVALPAGQASSRMNLGVLAERAHQCFGHWTGWICDDAGDRVPVDGVLGWAEDIHNRW